MLGNYKYNIHSAKIIKIIVCVFQKLSQIWDIYQSQFIFI